MKKIYYLFSLLFLFTAFFSCTKNNKISINKVVGSPAYETSKLTMKEPILNGMNTPLILMLKIMISENKQIKNLLTI